MESDHGSLYNAAAPDQNLNHTNITTFAKANGEMLIGTFGGGIVVRSQDQQAYRYISMAEGLPDNRVMTLMVDRLMGCGLARERMVWLI